jgi:magnesium transporter
MTTILAYHNGKMRHLSIQDLFVLRATNPDFPAMTIWVDLENPTEEEEETLLVHFFLFHHLAVEDCQRERVEPKTGDHYPKVEDYHDYIYVIFNPVDRPVEKLDDDEEDDRHHYVAVQFPTRQLNAFLGKNFLVTHHYEASEAIRYARNLCLKNNQTLGRGPDYLFHLIIDEVVDNYTPVMDYFDHRIDELESNIFEAYQVQMLSRILELKKGIVRLRRITTYQREILNRLSRGEFPLISTQEMIYYRNVYDHLVRIADLVDSYREHIAGLLEAYLSVNSNRMNQVMKVLTVISTIFLPLTFISSIYGMNFHYLPELDWHYGYHAVWGVIVLIAGGMLIYFKRKGWLD